MSKKLIGFVTLGCAKNTVYTESMIGQVAHQDNYELTEKLEDAHVIVVNTCGFINAAKEETINTLLELNDLKSSGQLQYLIAIGCMVQKYAEELESAMPEIDLLLGSTTYEELFKHIDDLYHSSISQKRIVNHDWKLLDTSLHNERLLSTPNYYAYLTIAEGCDNHCTFCAIPEMQGPFRSRTIEDILNEARSLVDQGVQELILIAQDTTSYGIDLYKKYALSDLLKELCKIDKLKWIRLLYAYPNNFTDELIETIASEEKICKYIDMPLQHGDDKILKRMNRKIDQASIRHLIDKLRAKIPNIVIRSTFIVGFPGETEEAYENLLRFIQEIQLDRVGVFPYSQEENTIAGKMDDQLPDDIKETRAAELMDIQFDIMYQKHQKMLSSIREVFVDEIDNDFLLCRSFSEAPDIDPFILIPKEENPTAMIGDLLTVKILNTYEYDLIGSIISK